MFDGQIYFGSLRLYDELLNTLKYFLDLLKITDSIIYIYIYLYAIYIYIYIYVMYILFSEGYIQRYSPDSEVFFCPRQKNPEGRAVPEGRRPEGTALPEGFFLSRTKKTEVEAGILLYIARRK